MSSDALWKPLSIDVPGPPPSELDRTGIVALVPLGDRAWAAGAAVTLARSLARGGRRVYLCDLDLEAPRLHDMVGMPREAGVSDFALYGASPSHVATEVEDRLLFVSAGTPVAGLAPVFASGRWEGLFESVVHQRALLLLFVPPRQEGAAALLARVEARVALGDPTGVPAVTEMLAGVRLGFQPPSARVEEIGMLAPEDDVVGAIDLEFAAAAATPPLIDDFAPDEAEVSVPVEGLTGTEASGLAEAQEVDEEAPLVVDDAAPIAEDAVTVDDASPIAEVLVADEDGSPVSEDAVTLEDVPPVTEDVAVVDAPAVGGLSTVESPQEPSGAAQDPPPDEPPPWASVLGGGAGVGGSDGAEADDVREPESLTVGEPAEPLGAFGDSRVEEWDDMVSDEAVAANASKSRAPWTRMVVLLGVVVVAVVGAARMGWIDVPGVASRRADPGDEAPPPVTATDAATPDESPGEDAPDGDLDESPTDIDPPAADVGVSTAPIVAPHQVWSLRIGSYSGQAVARREALALTARVPDHVIVIAPVEVDGRRWWRLVSSLATDREMAEGLRLELGAALADVQPSDWLVRRAPGAYLLDETGDLASARASAAEWRDRGIDAYVMRVAREGGANTFRIYAGAYSNEEEASVMRGLLLSAGVDAPQFVDRRGILPE